jgi:hypothetical protein
MWQVIQPGLAGLMDGSVSTLAPIFAAASATHPMRRVSREVADRWLDSPLLCSAFRAVAGGVMVVAVGVLIGSS